MAIEKCILYGEDCTQEDHSECAEAYRKYCTVIFCNDDRCMWNVGIQTKKFIATHRGHQPFPDDYFRGICGRPGGIGLRPEIIETPTVKHKKTVCSYRSDKHISGHLDFSKLPQGGNIPDPVEGTAYL